MPQVSCEVTISHGSVEQFQQSLVPVTLCRPVTVSIVVFLVQLRLPVVITLPANRTMKQTDKEVDLLFSENRGKILLTPLGL